MWTETATIKEKKKNEQFLRGVSKTPTLTRDAAEEPERGCVARIVVDHALGRRLRQGQRQRDGLVELPSPGLHGDDRRDGHPVAQQLGRQLRRDRLSLEEKKNKTKTVIECFVAPAVSSAAKIGIASLGAAT